MFMVAWTLILIFAFTGITHESMRDCANHFVGKIDTDIQQPEACKEFHRRKHNKIYKQYNDGSTLFNPSLPAPQLSGKELVIPSHKKQETFDLMKKIRATSEAVLLKGRSEDQLNPLEKKILGRIRETKLTKWQGDCSSHLMQGAVGTSAENHLGICPSFHQLPIAQKLNILTHEYGHAFFPCVLHMDQKNNLPKKQVQAFIASDSYEFANLTKCLDNHAHLANLRSYMRDKEAGTAPPSPPEKQTCLFESQEPFADRLGALIENQFHIHNPHFSKTGNDEFYFKGTGFLCKSPSEFKSIYEKRNLFDLYENPVARRLIRLSFESNRRYVNCEGIPPKPVCHVPDYLQESASKGNYPNTYPTE